LRIENILEAFSNKLTNEIDGIWNRWNMITNKKVGEYGGTSLSGV
jgi:hypothetical protein